KREPVCITAGAMGGGLPHSDLYVSADHGMVLDGLVINASALVNGDTIRFVSASELPRMFIYYHIETEAHDVILANGAAAETFVDAVSRRDFDNYQEYLELYGTERIIPEMPMPRISSQRLVPHATKDRLRRAVPLANEKAKKRA
ncbi:MAG: Hint domain-containing protein, partial [Pseudomonadota bacterium]